MLALIILGLGTAAVVGVVSNAGTKAAEQTKAANAAFINSLTAQIESLGTDDVGYNMAVASNAVGAVITELLDGVALRDSNLVVKLPDHLNAAEFASGYYKEVGSRMIHAGDAPDAGGDEGGGDPPGGGGGPPGGPPVPVMP